MDFVVQKKHFLIYGYSNQSRNHTTKLLNGFLCLMQSKLRFNGYFDWLHLNLRGYREKVINSIHLHWLYNKTIYTCLWRIQKLYDIIICFRLNALLIDQNIVFTIHFIKTTCVMHTTVTDAWLFHLWMHLILKCMNNQLIEQLLERLHCIMSRV